MIDTVLRWIGVGDAAIAAMGPVLTLTFAWLFGGAAAQWLKFPLSRAMNRDNAAYDWSVRTMAVVLTFAFAHFIGDSLNTWFEVGIAVTQPVAYYVAIRAIRRWAPWLEVSKLIGSVEPPAEALRAAADRQAQP